MVSREEKKKRKELAEAEAKKRGISLKPVKQQSALGGPKSPLKDLAKTEEGLSKERLKNEEKEVGLLKGIGNAISKAHGEAVKGVKGAGKSAWKWGTTRDRGREKRL